MQPKILARTCRLLLETSKPLSLFLKKNIFLGFTDHSRPPLSRAVPNRRSPPLRTLSAGQQNGARFYNKAMSSEMPFQVPHNWVGTTPQDADTHYSIHVVAHKDSSRFTLPPPRVEFARLSLNLSAELSGRHSVLWRLDSRPVFSFDWHACVIYWGQLYLGMSITPVDLSQWRCFYSSSLLCCHTRLL